MSQRFSSHLFWGSYSPLSILTVMGLMILASSRLAFALVCAAALIWVYGFTALAYSFGRLIMPARGKLLVLLFLSTFFCGIFLILMGLFNPLLILGTSFFLLLIPPSCLGSGFFEASESIYPAELISRALLEAVVIAALVIAIALIREPLGMGTLSLPGGAHGIVELFQITEHDNFGPIRILSASAGGLLLMGYGVSLFRFFRERAGNTPRTEIFPEEMK